MKDLEPLATRVAHARYSDHRFCGYGALTELLGNETYMGLLSLAAGAKRLSVEDRDLLDALAVALAAGDPRIWPLKITRLVASYGGLLPAFSAGQLCTEGSTIGGTVIHGAADLLVEMKNAIVGMTDVDASDRALRDMVVGAKRLPGYGVAFRPQDERVVALRPYLAARGRDRMEHWMLQERVSTIVRRERGLEPNLAVAAAAFLMDIGMTPRQAGVVATFAIQNTFIANAVEGAAQPAAVLRRLPDDRIEYVGREPRQTRAVPDMRRHS